MAENDNIKQIIVDGNAELLVSEAKLLGEKLAADLKKSQLRNIYATVKQVEVTGRFTEQEKRRVTLLIPRLQYLSARERGLKPLATALTDCIQLLTRAPSEELAKKQFRHFAEFFEAIVAYHYAAASSGGRP